MSELAFLIIAGVTVYVTGQIILRFFINPVHEQKKVIGEIADALIFYANVYSNPGSGPKEKMDEAEERLRQLSTLLQSRTHLIPLYNFLVRLHLVHPRKAVAGASIALRGISNAIHARPDQIQDFVSFNDERAKEIKELLNLRTHD